MTIYREYFAIVYHGTRTSCKIIAPEDTLSNDIKEGTEGYTLIKQRLVVKKVYDDILLF